MADEGKASLGKAYVQIIPSADGIQGQLESLLGGSSESAGASAGSKFGGALQAAAGVGVAALGASITATVGMGSAVMGGVSNLAQVGDGIDKMSQKMGLSAEAYQEWDFIMQHSGTSIDAMSGSMKKLASAAETGNKAFDALGMSQEQIAGMSQEELFGATISALQNVEDETERTYLASQLLGRGATELGPLLNTSAEDLEAMRQQAHDLGGVLSDEAVKSAAAYQDSLQNLQTGFDGLKNGMLADFLPSFTGVMDGITGIMTGAADGPEKLQEGISGVANKLTELVPRVFEIGKPIIAALAQALMDNLPTILQTGMSLLGELAMGILEALPDIIEAGVSTIGTFAQTLGDNLPELIPKAVDMILSIAKTLTDPDNIAAILEAGVQIIIGLGKGLIAAIPELVANIPEIIWNMVSAFLGYDWAGVGWDIIGGIADGVLNAIPNLLSSVGSAASSALDRAKGLLGIASPSRVFADQVGRYIPEGIAQGVTGNLGPIHEAMEIAGRESVRSVPVSALRGAGAENGATAVSNASGALAALEGLYALLNRYLPELAERDVVLDDGTLVGRLAPEIDRELGRMQMMEARG